MKRTLAIGGVAAALLLVPLATADAASAAPALPAAVTADQTCEQLGQTNIQRGEPSYRPALDEDGDGVACEEGNGATAPVSQTDDSGSSTSDGSGDSSSDGSGDSSSDGSGDSSSDGTSSDGTSSDGDDQVEVVPDGGAPTGDGSTDGSATPYWVGGGLAALLAAAGITLRKRVFTRS